MRPAHLNSLVAGTLLLILALRHVLPSMPSHIGALWVVMIVCQSAGSVFCFWHAFQGPGSLFGMTELEISRFFSVLALGLGAGLTFIWIRYHRDASELFTAIACYAAGVFFRVRAWRERQSITANQRT